jgi:DNA polymerase-3 subunit delta
LAAHLLYGDSFLVSRQLDRLTGEAGADSLLEANRHQLTGGQFNLPELLAVCNALPFMDACRLVVVTGLLATLESRGGRGRGARSLGEWDKLADAIPQMPETTLLFLVDGPIADSNPLLRSLRPVTQAQLLQAPTGEALARYVKDLAQHKGSGISPAAIRTITDLVGNDLWTLDRELEKLSLYASGRNIEESDIQEMVAQVREASIFNAVDAMIDGRPEVALLLLQRLRQDGAALPYIISMVERQLRLVCLARYWTEQRVSPQDLPSKLGVPPFVARKTAEQARRNSWPDLDRRYRRLLEADLDFKTGRVDSEDLALELLVVDLAGPGSQDRNRGRRQG